MNRLPLLLGALALPASTLLAQHATPAPAAAQVAGAKNVTPDAAEKLLKEQPVTVLDVRTPQEFAGGHIKGAVNISSADPDFSKKVAALDKSKPVLVHCAAGGRSSRMLPKVAEQKFPAIYHLNEGFNAWEDAGKPVEKSSSK